VICWKSSLEATGMKASVVENDVKFND